jgi:beta-lactamase regulating signal transducer with metallopeptidase domain
MNLTQLGMQSDWLKALGWTFVHSLWQIAAIGFLLYVILRLTQDRSAHVRYTISTMAVWMIVIMVLSTFIIMLPDSNSITEITGQFILVNTPDTISQMDRISMWLELRMPMMLSIWFGGVLILMLRLGFSLGWVYHMRSVAVPVESIQKTMDELIHRLQLKIKPNASESGHVSSPVTIGHIKPMILFPIGIINQLTPNEVEAILTHELAHIVRRDYLSNLIQSFIETLFYYHPVTWWISRMVRTERENRADDLAVSWCGDHLGYAKALITVQEMQVGSSPSLAIGFTSGKGAMLTRIQRILHIPYKNNYQMEKTVLISLCSLFFLGFTLKSNSITEQNKENPGTKKELSTISITVTDSIPVKGTYKIHKKTDDQDINIEVQDGDIKELKIDGKEISPDEFDEYEEIIEELFTEMEAPPSMEDFEMHEMAPVPSVYGMPVMPAMPPMPPMLSMDQQLEMERAIGECPKIAIWNGQDLDHLEDLKIISKGGPIIVIHDGDTTIIESENLNIHLPYVAEQFKMYSPDINIEHYLHNKEAWKQNQEQWKENEEQWKENEEQWKRYAEEWKQNWEENAEQWKEEWRAQEEQMRIEQDHMRSEGDRMREEELEQHLSGQYERSLQDALEAEGMAYGRIHGMGSPVMNITDAMIEEGFVEPGEEAEILLTPDKLKINGEKMPDDVHQRYLQMYEDQQGVELSGNSRIEFKTKSRRSM